ncbi:LysR substrate-binding domain-containing protein [Shewanella surugensis]|uniref:LysR substrate-binding domain-containing protein n=1 Tax=Shewanella surugensis TaxID=212020 RepID=A0ABT0LIH7_9GAMM|nr:LysR substrate-binding domain-containing protein [Shewanella surugensis]MCL1126936.1 LysR substrate-binding domain-containing protein [Shewanella surugensis]
MNDINWRGVDLNLLLTFDAMMRFHSVSAASEYLHLGQPATSYNLKRLRQLLNDPLFERQGNIMVPTCRATEIAPKVTTILKLIKEEILPQNTFIPTSFEGTFSIGLSDYTEQIFGPNLFDELQKTAPKAKILFKSTDNNDAKQLIENNDIDIAVGVFSLLPTSLIRSFLYSERHVCMFDNQQMKITLPISRQEYLSTPQIIITGNNSLTTPVDITLQEQKKQRNVVLGTTRFLTARNMLSGRKLLAVMAELVGKTELIDDQITLCAPPIDIPDFNIDMISKKRDQAHPRMRWLTQLVKTQIQIKVADIRKQ